MSLAAKATDCKVELLTPVRTATDRGFTTRQADGGRLVVRTGRQSIDLWALLAPAQFGTRFQLKQQFQFLFQQAAGAKGYVEEKDLAGPAGVQFQQLKVVFDPADRDADGKLTKDEFDKYFDLQQQFVDLGLSVTCPSCRQPVAVTGSSLRPSSRATLPAPAGRPAMAASICQPPTRSKRN